MQRIVRKLNQKVAAFPKRKRVAGYTRVSSGQEAMLHSLSAQVSYYSKLIQSNPEWEYTGVYTDEAVTGTKGSRPGLHRLLADCRAGKIDMIITKSISRFARNTVTMLEIVRELKAIGVDVFFEKENILVGPPESRETFWGEEESRNGELSAVSRNDEWRELRRDGELMLTILSSFAQEESLSVSENCKWRIRDKFKKGEPANWNFMFGYNIVCGKIGVNETEAKIVKYIFEEYVDGVGTTQIAHRLKNRGIKTRFNGEWTPKKIEHMLNNEKYTGNSLLQKKFVADHLTKKLVYNKGQLPRYYAEGTHPWIIDMETFNKAQRILKKNYEKMRHKTSTTSRYAFSGLIKCENCGKSYRRKIEKSIFWRCATYLTKGKNECASGSITEDLLISLTKSVLKTDKIDDSIREKIQKIIISKTDKIKFLMHDGTEIEAKSRSKRRDLK